MCFQEPGTGRTKYQNQTYLNELILFYFILFCFVLFYFILFDLKFYLSIYMHSKKFIKIIKEFLTIELDSIELD